MKLTFSFLATGLALLYGNTSTEAALLRRRAEVSVCSAFEIAEFDCYIDEPRDVVGVYVCRSGTTTCVSPSDTRSSDTCGCCDGDNRLACLDDGDGPEDALVDTPTTTTVTTTTTANPMVTNTTASLANADGNEICSAFEIMEFDCDVRDDVVGVYVCRSGVTTCSLVSDLQAGDSCGCCVGDNRLECLNDGDSPGQAEEASTLGSSTPETSSTTSMTTITASNGICSAAQMMEFDCDIQDDVVGVLVCRGGVTTCTLASGLQNGDSCGCCAGDNRLACLDDAAEDALEFTGGEDANDENDTDNDDEDENENGTPSFPTGRCPEGQIAMYIPEEDERRWECRSPARSGNPDIP